MADIWRAGALVAAPPLGLLLAAGALAAAELSAAAPAADEFSELLALRLVAGGLDEPVGIVFTGLLTDTRLFVVERGGLIKIVEAAGQVRAAPFLSLTGQLKAPLEEEEGLLGLAFAPDYAATGDFYVYYTNPAGDNQLARVQVSADPNVAAITETVVLTIAHQPLHHHNGGGLKFGPDGLLYLAPGDGGGVSHNNSQDLSLLLGKVLRINVTGTPTYTVPAGNPFTQTIGARPEIWALGLRNPWRFSFDSATGDLYLADVGRALYEEINRQPAGSPGGENYGWRCYEGPHDNDLPDCGITHTLPLYAYPHTGSQAVVGGYVYRGARYPAWLGRYLFADFVTGEFWALDPDTQTVMPLGAAGVNPTTFGQDSLGELYVADYAGAVYHVEPLAAR